MEEVKKARNPAPRTAWGMFLRLLVGAFKKLFDGINNIVATIAILIAACGLFGVPDFFQMPKDHFAAISIRIIAILMALSYLATAFVRETHQKFRLARDAQHAAEKVL